VTEIAAHLSPRRQDTARHIATSPSLSSLPGLQDEVTKGRSQCAAAVPCTAGCRFAIREHRHRRRRPSARQPLPAGCTAPPPARQHAADSRAPPPCTRPAPGHHRTLVCNARMCSCARHSCRTPAARVAPCKAGCKRGRRRRSRLRLRWARC